MSGCECKPDAKRKRDSAQLQEKAQPSIEKEAPMSHRSLALTAALAAVVLVALLAQAPATGQTPSSATKATTAGKACTTPHTPADRPDLQGIYSDNTLTPFERPTRLAATELT